MLCWYALTFKFSRSGHRRDGRFCPQIGGKNRRQLIYLFHPEMRRWSLQGLPQQVNMFSRERPHSRFKGSWEDDLPVKICSFPGGYLLIKSRLFLFHIKMHLQLLYYCEGLPSVFLDIVRYSFGGQPSSFAALLDIEWLRSLATLTTGFWTFLNAPPPKKKCYVFYLRFRETSITQQRKEKWFVLQARDWPAVWSLRNPVSWSNSSGAWKNHGWGIFQTFFGAFWCPKNRQTSHGQLVDPSAEIHGFRLRRGDQRWMSKGFIILDQKMRQKKVKYTLLWYVTAKQIVF